MRTQKIQPKVNRVVEKARKDALKNTEKLKEYRDMYPKARSNFLMALAYLKRENPPVILERIDALLNENEDTISNADFISLECYIRFLSEDEVWLKVKEAYAIHMEVMLKKEKDRWGNELFELVEESLAKRNNDNFWPVSQDTALLFERILKHIDNEPELYSLWQRVREDYIATFSKVRLSLAKEWNYIIVGIKTLIKQALSEEGGEEDGTYEGIKKFLFATMSDFPNKIESKKKQLSVQTIEIEDDDDVDNETK